MYYPLWEVGVLCSEVVLFSEVTNVLVTMGSECPLFRGCPLLRDNKCTSHCTMGSECPLFRGCPLFTLVQVCHHSPTFVLYDPIP